MEEYTLAENKRAGAARGKEYSMDKKLRETAETILHSALRAVQPDAAVRRALENAAFPGRVCLVAVGKAAWQMAHAAYETLGERISSGIVVTKYEHARGPIAPLRIREAGHPVADENSFAAAKEVLEMTAGLRADDTVLFLVSGGGSALFELPLIEPAEQQEITRQLLACGADIVEMNTIRKRLSAVKGGRFAQHCSPAHVFSIVLSDIIGDPLDMIASGPAYPDASTEAQALEIVRKYDLRLSEQAMDCLRKPTPKMLSNVETHVTGSVRELCAAAMREAEALGFRCQMLTDCLCCQAKEAGSFLASVARSHQDTGVPLAFLAGGETTVHLTGSGLGGRNQELALAAAPGISGLRQTAVFSFGSDGTDGPTDAAGGYADQDTLAALQSAGWDAVQTLRDNNAYHALQAVGGLLMTGPTGTNVNDLAMVLIAR